MKTQPHPSDREVLVGLVDRVTYQNAENGFFVIRVKARSHRELVTVVGHAATISAGEWITPSGDWVNDRTHGQVSFLRRRRTGEFAFFRCFMMAPVALIHIKESLQDWR